MQRKRMTEKGRMNKGAEAEHPLGMLDASSLPEPGSGAAAQQFCLLVVPNGMENTGMPWEAGEQIRWLISWFRASFV